MHISKYFYYFFFFRFGYMLHVNYFVYVFINSDKKILLWQVNFEYGKNVYYFGVVNYLLIGIGSK